VKSILIVDDERNIVDLLRLYLEKEGFAVLAATDGEQALAMHARHEPDLVILDLMLPRRDGFDVCREIRRRGETPVIMLTARGDDVDAIVGLELGADDYVTKPFSVPELLARVRTQLRRATPQRMTLEFDELSIDLARRRVRQGDRDVRLTPTEFAILELLATNAGKPVSSREIARRVWNSGEATPDTVRVHVGSLRRKLEPDPSIPRYIVTEPWVGYRFIAEPQE
jgi:DNA-binding response OmpR family regulator